MRKTCKNHPKNEQKTHQKSSKNRPKKHTEKLTTHFQPKVREILPKGGQKTTAKGGKGRDPGWNPPRKKKNTAKTRPTAGKGCMRERLHADTPKFNTLRGRAAPWPGGESRLPAAIVPPPGLGEIVCTRKFARNLIPGSMQEYFFENFFPVI